MEAILTLRTKGEMDTFLASLKKNDKVQQCQLGTHLYYQVPLTVIQISDNTLFYEVMEDRNLDALILQDSYIICDERITDIVYQNLKLKNPSFFKQLLEKKA